MRAAEKRLDSTPFLIDILVNNTFYTSALFDTVCLPFAGMSKRFVDR